MFALRSEPKTLNPVTSVDSASRDVIGRLTANLVAIDRHTQRTGRPSRSRGGLRGRPRYTLELRRGLRFSDGDPFDADDVVFSFECYLDERNGSPQRDLLIVGGKPVAVRKLGPYRVALEMAQPYAVGERLFDGVAMLPRHLLAKAQQDGRLAEAWGLGHPAGRDGGAGPLPAEGIRARRARGAREEPALLEGGPGGRAGCPTSTRSCSSSCPARTRRSCASAPGRPTSSAASARRTSRCWAKEAAGRFRLDDLGPGLEYSFLFFNLNDLPGKLDGVARKQAWFRDAAFRRAVSAALDRRGWCAWATRAGPRRSART